MKLGSSPPRPSPSPKSGKGEVIGVRQLTKEYAVGETEVVRALDQVSVSIGEGEFVSLVGRSGSGKTTFLHSLGLLLRPTSGEILVEGVETSHLSERQRADLRGRRVGFVFENLSLLPDLTVLQNVLLPTRYSWAWRGRQQRGRELLELVGMADQAERRPDQLTGGQAQRVAIARALVRRPAVVLADEPTGEVDNETSDDLLFLMQQVNRTTGVAFVVVTHDMEVATCMDRMIVIRDGQLASDERLR